MCSRHNRKITTSPTKCLHSPTNEQQSLRSDRRKTTSSVVVAVVQCRNFIWIDYLRRISTNFAKRSSIVEALIVRWRRFYCARWSSLIYDGGCRRSKESRILRDRNLLISHAHIHSQLYTNERSTEIISQIHLVVCWIIDRDKRPPAASWGWLEWNLIRFIKRNRSSERKKANYRENVIDNLSKK